MTVSHQPMYIGQTDPPWSIPLNTDGGADDISALDIHTFTMTFRTISNQDTLGKGEFAVNKFFPAEVYYQPDPADVAFQFQGYLIIKALTGDGRMRIWDPIGGTAGGYFIISPS